MSIKKISIATVTGIAFLASSATWAATDACSTLADLTTKSDNSVFVGYATSSTSQNEADQNSRLDLARSIRQQVSATSTVTESTGDATLNTTSKSVVSEVLVGAKVLRRCPDDKTFSTVVTLQKDLFLSSLAKKLTGLLAKAKKLKDSISTTGSVPSDEVLAQNVDNAKKFLADHQSTVDDDLNLCKIYRGCADVDMGSTFQDLADLVAKQADKDQYIFVAGKNTDNVADKLKDSLVSLLGIENIKIMDDNLLTDVVSTTRKVIANCTAKIGTPISDTTDRVIKLKCSLDGYSGKEKKFRYTYSCSAMGTTQEDGITACSDRLKKD